ncbi:tetratricopeptide repeat protein [Steroidobacter sp.]|uniref:tetratricopeptide repeat protein n=1 Tax=Steroidobacter sp. TaxID=1978227 RepID=UPI0025E6ED55|nr:tetratricopeptide repeat protein [Steroidobacter sp.]
MAGHSNWRNAWLAMAWAALPAVAAEHDHDSLGKVSMPVSCSVTAQAQFNQALALLHHMTYPQAREAFEKALQIEPGCAMAHWGVAMTLFQPLWPTRPSHTALQRGWEEVQQTKSLRVSPREQYFVAAAEAFFQQPESSDYWLRIRRWEQASLKAYEALPGDDEAALFYALSHLATTPASGKSREHADEAAAILFRVYQKQPDHPGAMHYLVHANDVPGRERELLDITRKYEAIAPNNPHALHMPTHIYTRLGEWDGVIKGNLRAADAALLHPAGEHGELVWDEFAHAIEYLIYAYLQQGADVEAAEQLQRLRSTGHMEPTFKTAFHLASTQTRFALERRAWNEAVHIEPRTPTYLDWDRFMWAEAIARFGRGLGAAHLGKQDEVTAALTRLTELEGVASKAGEDLFARSIKVLNLELSAWSAHEQGQHTRSVEIMQQAAELEAATPKHAVTPGPTLPAYELLGDLYMELKKPTEALAAYRRSGELYPRRFNSLLGAAHAARDLGDKASARAYYSQLLELAAPDSPRLQIKEAKQYVAGR